MEVGELVVFLTCIMLYASLLKRCKCQFCEVTLIKLEFNNLILYDL